MSKTITFTITADRAEVETEDLDDIVVDVEYTGRVNHGLVLRHLAEEVEAIFKKYLKNGEVKDVTLAR